MAQIYAIGNAHLDPAWMWTWQEGSAEAKATLRSALDRMKEYPEFRFVCSSASVFQWIEEFDPKMFEEIRQRVHEGRFILVGGMHVQPDCNLPSGEGFARQTLYAQRYFYDRFGVTAKVGYNVDSFGHNAMLPQILKKSGMNYYIFMRPCDTENPELSNLFRWISPDGTSVLTARIPQPYNYYPMGQKQLSARIQEIFSVLPEGSEEALLFYGVGNHGGGPTKRNIETILQYNKENDNAISFADPEEYFQAVEKRNPVLPEWHDDLQHHASGCYSAVSEIKTLNRRSETALTKAEFSSFLASSLLDRKFPTEELRRGWKNVCFNHFHDILGGCAIEIAYEDVRSFAHEALSISTKLTNNAYQSLSWAVDTSDSACGLPIVVFNSHPFEATALVSINKQACAICDENGKNIPMQYIASPTKACTMRDDTIFVAKIPPLGYRTYYMQNKETVLNYLSSYKEAKFDKKELFQKHENTTNDFVSVTENSMENEFFKCTFSPEQGKVLSIFDKISQKELLSHGGSEWVVIDEKDHDTWSHAKNYFDQRIGEFSGDSFKILETGPVRARVKLVSRYGESKLTQYFSLTSGLDEIRVDAQIDWHEKQKMLKLSYQTSFEESEVYYEIPFGVIKRPPNGEEEPMLSWAALKNKNGEGFALLNNNKYSASVKGSVFSLTAVRSPLYGDHGRTPHSEMVYTDQGAHSFSYVIKSLRKEDSWHTLIQAARVLNTPLTEVLENHHQGFLPLTSSCLKISAENILISALKRSEDGKGTVVRLYETDGKASHFTLELPKLPILEADASPYSIQTFRLDDGEKEWREVLITEFEIDE